MTTQNDISSMQKLFGSNELLFIYALCQGGTLEKAAKLLEKNPSSVYRAIQKIEQAIGAPLFTRSKQGYAPNDLARELAVQGEVVFKAINTANDFLSSGQRDGKVTLKITTTDLLFSCCLLPIFARYSDENPAIDFNISISNDTSMLWEREFDLAIRPTNFPPETMIGRKITQFSHKVSASNAYWEKLKSNKTVQTWLIPGGEIKNHYYKIWSQENAQADACFHSFDSMLAIRNAAMAGIGQAILPDLKGALDGLVEDSRCHFAEKTDLWLLYHPDSRANQAISDFARYIQSELSDR
ncbi:LysR family transcriptional regulator [Pelagibaculum spongiae]|uniref:HTH lysR-type domain-containing protein n=1 Tax=Pelagibaculum spongiae TaxID=2080658 RepID=A0A2V1H4R2_9GAMM|nr:LysR family transcriptional regulator [Pelagibaculum spongiae]PVZ71765.1 hypothetical protein DC094_01690 [Pelagibaculum spongiae]